MSDEYVDINTSVPFELPCGLEKNGKVYKKGRMKLLSNKDILEIGDDPDLQKYADSKIEITGLSFNLAKLNVLNKIKVVMAKAMLPRCVIFEGLEQITKDDIENMYNVDMTFLMKLADDMVEAAEGEKPKLDKESEGESKPPLP